MHADSFDQIFEQHAATVYRVCLGYTKNAADAEDATADTFERLIASGKRFESDTHVKYWLIRVAGNVCKNQLRRRRHENIDDHRDLGVPEYQHNETLDAVLNLPPRLKAAVYLHFVEELTTLEVSRALKKPHSTIRSHIREAKKILSQQLGVEI